MVLTTCLARRRPRPPPHRSQRPPRPNQRVRDDLTRDSRRLRFLCFPIPSSSACLVSCKRFDADSHVRLFHFSNVLQALRARSTSFARRSASRRPTPRSDTISTTRSNRVSTVGMRPARHPSRTCRLSSWTLICFGFFSLLSRLPFVDAHSQGAQGRCQQESAHTDSDFARGAVARVRVAAADHERPHGLVRRQEGVSVRHAGMHLLMRSLQLFYLSVWSRAHTLTSAHLFAFFTVPRAIADRCTARR